MMEEGAQMEDLAQHTRGLFLPIKTTGVNWDEQKRDLMRILEAQMQRHLESVVDKKTLRDIKVADIEDVWRNKMQYHQREQKYLAKVKVIATVCIPLTSFGAESREHVIQHQELGQDMTEAGKAATVDVGSEDPERTEFVVMIDLESEPTEECQQEVAETMERKVPTKILPAVSASMMQQEGKLLDVGDFESYNFNSDRSEEKFTEGQVRALYDEKDSEECQQQVAETMERKVPTEIHPAMSASIIVQQEGKLIDVGDFESYNFDSDRSEDKFTEGQVWALYDERDAMPRNYVYINQIRSKKPFDVLISWLEPKARGHGKSIVCGEFVVEKKMQPLSYVDCFSHVVKWSIEKKSGDILIMPEKGDVWALLSAFEIAQYSEIVQVVGDSEDLSAITVRPLRKVPGCHATFMPQDWTFEITMSDLARFSHRIPAFVVQKGVSGTVRFLELDPAAF